MTFLTSQVDPWLSLPFSDCWVLGDPPIHLQQPSAAAWDGELPEVTSQEPELHFSPPAQCSLMSKYIYYDLAQSFCTKSLPKPGPGKEEILLSGGGILP